MVISLAVLSLPRECHGAGPLCGFRFIEVLYDDVVCGNADSDDSDARWNPGERGSDGIDQDEGTICNLQFCMVCFVGASLPL